MKAYSGKYLLKVSKLNGKYLKNPPLMEYSNLVFAKNKLPSNDFGLYEYKYDKKVKMLTDKQIAELLDIDQRTVAGGRKELLCGDVDVDINRKKGGGRKQIKKKSQT